MYSRPPERQKPRVKIPDNYSGNAFRTNEPYNDMPPPTRLDLPPQERRERIDDRQERQEGATREPYFEQPFEQPSIPVPLPIPSYPDQETPPQNEASPSPTAKADTPASLFSLLPGLSGRFPFGHGLGSEELLILAVMLTVSLAGERQDDDDRALLLMLGLLLFAG